MKSADSPFSVAKAEDSSGFLLWQVTSLWQREIKKALQPFDLTHSQFVLLASIHWLTLLKKDVTQIVLSEHSKIDPMTTSQVLRTLATKGIVTRAEHATDTRAKTVVLTEKGKKLVKPAVNAVEKCDREFFAPLRNGQGFNAELMQLLRAPSA
ncbi:MAG: MarR family transcriptional regulator [Turneriella sp.]